MAVGTFKREAGRKAIHAFIMLFPCIYFFFRGLFGHLEGLLALVALLVLGIVIEYLRLEHRVRLPILSWLWDNFRREKQKDRMGAEIYALLGVIVALGVFDIRVATAAIMMSIFGDSAAALVGVRYGRIQPAIFRGKSIEGSAAALVINLMVAFIFLRSYVDHSSWWLKVIEDPGSWSLSCGFGEPLWPVIIVMSLVATVVELMISEINDNLTVPVISGFSGQAVLLMM